jgi:hypothetical protein
MCCATWLTLHDSYSDGDEFWHGVTTNTLEALADALEAPTLLVRAMAGDATAARQFLHEAGFTEPAGPVAAALSTLLRRNPMTESTTPRAVFFEKDGDKIVIWTNHKRWTVTDMVAGGTKRYTKQLAMALSASLMAEGYEATVHD